MAAKTVKAVKANRKNGRPTVKRKRVKTKDELDFEAQLIEIEHDPNATPMAKALAPLLRERIESGEPYLTIEQIMEELGRRF